MISIQDISSDEALALLSDISDEEALALLHLWDFWARKDQIEPPPLYRGHPWALWLLMGGRGAGKTRTGAEWLRQQFEGSTPLSGSPHRIGMLVGANPAEVRDVMIEGPSGILAVSPPDFRPEYRPGTRRLIWPNGAYCMIRSASDPESLRGPNIEVAWTDEVAKWRYQKETWDNLQFCLREGPRPRVCGTTTPRPTKLVRELVNDPHTVVTQASTLANSQFLNPAFIERVQRKYGRSRLGRQEIYGELLDDNPYALFKLKDIERARVRTAPIGMQSVKVAVDPPTSSGEDADECGIIVAGRKGDQAYVIADYSMGQCTPEEWARKVCQAYIDHEADGIIAEVNQGGEMVRSVIHAQAKLPVQLVRAFRGKVLRAEPVSLLYENGQVHHIGHFPELEDQMNNITIDWDRDKDGSPDRVDALVYCVTDLLIDTSVVEDDAPFETTESEGAQVAEDISYDTY